MPSRKVKVDHFRRGPTRLASQHLPAAYPGAVRLASYRLKGESVNSMLLRVEQTPFLWGDPVGTGLIC